MHQNLFFFWLFAGENQYVKRSGIGTRIVSVGRLVTPRSPAGNAFDNAGDSDEEGTELANEDDILFSYGYIDSSTDITNAQVCVVLFT